MSVAVNRTVGSFNVILIYNFDFMYIKNYYIFPFGRKAIYIVLIDCKFFGKKFVKKISAIIH